MANEIFRKREREGKRKGNAGKSGATVHLEMAARGAVSTRTLPLRTFHWAPRCNSPFFLKKSDISIQKNEKIKKNDCMQKSLDNTSTSYQFYLCPRANHSCTHTHSHTYTPATHTGYFNENNKKKPDTDSLLFRIYLDDTMTTGAQVNSVHSLKVAQDGRVDVFIATRHGCHCCTVHLRPPPSGCNLN